MAPDNFITSPSIRSSLCEHPFCFYCFCTPLRPVHRSLPKGPVDVPWPQVAMEHVDTERRLRMQAEQQLQVARTQAQVCFFSATPCLMPDGRVFLDKNPFPPISMSA